ncbi:MAG: carbohydrate ABC transporter permease [Clostridia bacterium]|nr:carbohydrate ABC transporter permease [Clostridiales bacterium]MBQ6715666.1 carbohydrate ABC transporter permease [Clostridia bacterium]
MKKLGRRKAKELRFQISIEAILVILLVLSYIPMLLMLFLSSKTNWEIYNDFFGLPRTFIWSNYTNGFNYLVGNMGNTLLVIFCAVAVVLVLSALNGYVFGTISFPGKNFLYMLILVLMMIPGSLSLAANYSLIIDYGLLDTRWAVIFPWISGGLVIGTILARNSVEGLPKELYEAAKIEGAGHFRLLVSITVPLIKPILSTIAIMKIVDYYNDFTWPLLVISENKKQLVTVILRVFTSVYAASGMGIVYAGYVIASIPLLILFSFASRLYMEGMTAGAVKG